MKFFSHTANISCSGVRKPRQCNFQ